MRQIQSFGGKTNHGESVFQNIFLPGINGRNFSRREPILSPKQKYVFFRRQHCTSDHDSALVGSFCHNPRTAHHHFFTAQNGLFAIVVELWQAKTHTPKSKKPYPQMLQLGFEVVPGVPQRRCFPALVSSSGPPGCLCWFSCSFPSTRTPGRWGTPPSRAVGLLGRLVGLPPHR